MKFKNIIKKIKKNRVISTEEILNDIETQVKQDMNVKREEWFIRKWYPSILDRIFCRLDKKPPPRYVSKEEAQRAIENLKRFNKK